MFATLRSEYPSLTQIRQFNTSLPKKCHSFSDPKISTQIRHFNTNPRHVEWRVQVMCRSDGNIFFKFEIFLYKSWLRKIEQISESFFIYFLFSDVNSFKIIFGKSSSTGLNSTIRSLWRLFRKSCPQNFLNWSWKQVSK